METSRVDLGDGDSAELYRELRHGTSRRVQELYRPFLAKPEVKEALKSATEEEVLAKLYEIIAPTADVIGAADILILGQVKAWTFGAITQEVLDDMSERKREILLQEANKLYGEVPLPQGGAGR